MIIAVPEAESLVSDIRDSYDPAAMFGVPAHVSVLYPFMSPNKIESGIYHKLESLFSPMRSFCYRLEEIREFPETLYLAPEPDSGFVKVIAPFCANVAPPVAVPSVIVRDVHVPVSLRYSATCRTTLAPSDQERRAG